MSIEFEYERMKLNPQNFLMSINHAFGVEKSFY